jgi:hypothetical protein
LPFYHPELIIFSKDKKIQEKLKYKLELLRKTTKAPQPFVL